MNNVWDEAAPMDLEAYKGLVRNFKPKLFPHQSMIHTAMIEHAAKAERAVELRAAYAACRQQISYREALEKAVELRADMRPTSATIAFSRDGIVFDGERSLDLFERAFRPKPPRPVLPAPRPESWLRTGRFSPMDKGCLP